MGIEEGGDASAARRPAIPQRDYTVTRDSSMEGIPFEAIDSLVPKLAEGEIVPSAEFHAEHRGNSKREILATARAAIERAPSDRPRKAIILAAGECTDIPLRELAEDSRLDEITLVDIDRRGVEEAVRGLPLHYRRKIKIVTADLTGIGGELVSAVTALESREPKPSKLDFLRGIKKIVDGLRVRGRGPELGGDYAFVCSQLVMSRLESMPKRFLETAIARTTGLVLSSIPGKPAGELISALDELSESLQTEHIEYLAGLVSPLGGVHLADTYEVSMPSGGWYKEPIPVVAMEAISQTASRHFADLRPQVFWQWGRKGANKIFQVFSRSLQPKLQEASV